MLFAVAAFGVMTIVFGISHNLIVSLVRCCCSRQ